MPYISKKSRKFIFAFLGALVVAQLCQLFVPGIFMLRRLSTIIYLGITISWIITVQRRVTYSYIKGYLVMGGSQVALLFILRMMRWDLFSFYPTAYRFCWYAYYIPILAIPAFSLMLSLRVYKETRSFKKQYDYIIMALFFILAVMVLSNDLNRFTFRIEEEGVGGLVYSYGPGFAIVAAWCTLVTLLSFILLIRSNREGTGKGLALIPVGVCIVPCILLFIYFLNGGNAPELNGRAWYNFQEIYGMIYIGLWESSLRIGFIPSNSDYDDIFRLSNVKAAIADSDHNLRYLSNEAIPLNKEDIIKLESGEIIRLDENRTVKASELKVGTLLFVEDRTAVNELNVSLKEAIERSQEENSLLEIENEIKAEKQAIDVRNKLYDSISNRTRKQIEAIERILTKSEFMDRDPKESIGRCAVLGAYVKRQANLAILTEQYGKLKAEELRFAIRESMENLRLSGITADISGIDVEAEYDGKLLIFFYEIFEAVIEAAVPEIKTLSCILLGTNGLRMEILMDTPSSLPDMEAFPCETFDLVIEVLHEEEGVYVRVRENKANAPGKDNDKSGVGI